MRYEAKHQYFKHLTSTMGNFINLPYSLAMRHQCLQAYLLASGTAIRDEKEIGKGTFCSTYMYVILRYAVDIFYLLLSPRSSCRVSYPLC